MNAPRHERPEDRRGQAAVFVGNALFHLRKARPLRRDLDPLTRHFFDAAIDELECLADHMPADEITYPDHTGTGRKQ